MNLVKKVKDCFSKRGKQIKKIINGIIAGTIIIITIALSPIGKIKLCILEECYYLTPREYRELKIALIQRVENKDPLSYPEYLLLVKIYDFEIKHQKELQQYTDIKIGELLPKMNQIILKQK